MRSFLALVLVLLGICSAAEYGAGTRAAHTCAVGTPGCGDDGIAFSDTDEWGARPSPKCPTIT